MRGRFLRYLALTERTGVAMARNIWILAGIGLLAIVIALKANEGFGQPALIGLAIGAGLGLVIAFMTITRTKALLAKTADAKELMRVVTGGLAMMMIGALILAGLVYATTDVSSLGVKTHKIDPVACLICYVAILFFGFAMQAGLVQAALDGQNRDETEPQIGSGS